MPNDTFYLKTTVRSPDVAPEFNIKEVWNIYTVTNCTTEEEARSKWESSNLTSLNDIVCPGSPVETFSKFISEEECENLKNST